MARVGMVAGDKAGICSHDNGRRRLADVNRERVMRLGAAHRDAPQTPVRRAYGDNAIVIDKISQDGTSVWNATLRAT